MLSNFTTTTHGKWILAGEHAVLRGHPALVFPVDSKTLSLEYLATSDAITAEFGGESGDDIHLLFWSVLEHALQLIQKNISKLTGKFNLENNIPIGAGMGASAALCAALTRWLIKQGWVETGQMHAFARELEHLFHGQSSGIDIIGAAAINGTYFQQGQVSSLDINWSPYWYLSFCDQIGITSHCVKKVNSLWQRQPKLAEQIDQQMHDSVLMAVDALRLTAQAGLSLLAQAINQAHDCFRQWQLISEQMEQHITSLQQAGAIAAKPTGSGDGGFVLSLWVDAPPAALAHHMIRL